MGRTSRRLLWCVCQYQADTYLLTYLLQTQSSSVREERHSTHRARHTPCKQRHGAVEVRLAR